MNTLTLSVDELNSGTPANVIYDLVEIDKDRVTWQGPAHQADNRDLLQMYRTDAKRSGNSRGSRKTKIKLTRDVSCPNADGSGNIKLPVIVELSVSNPLGHTTLNGVRGLRQTMLAILDNDTLSDSVMDDLNILQSD